MGELIEAHFGLGLSSRAEAERRGCSVTTIDRERQGLDLPYRRVNGVNGHVYAARQLSAEQRRIKLLLGLGLTVTQIVETLDVSRGTVSRVAVKTKHRRKASRANRQARKGRGRDTG